MLQPDTLIQGRYRVVRPIGRGGMGAVYEAVDERLGGAVALKQTLAGPQLSRAFEREARLLAGLRHPALPRVIDHFIDGDGQFLVMDYVSGDDLGALLAQRGGPFPAERALAWADQLLAALEYLHGREPPVIHRDIKPQNLKLTPAGELVLLDFGLAKGSAAALTTASLHGYTPQYAPLEQINGAGTDPRSDLYSLAATLYHLLSGQAPANALERAAATLNHEPDPLLPLGAAAPDLAPPVADLIERALSLGAADRPPSAAAMRADLRLARAGTRRLALSGDAPTLRATRPRPAPPSPTLPGPLHRPRLADEPAPVPIAPAPARPLWATLIAVGLAGLVALGLLLPALRPAQSQIVGAIGLAEPRELAPPGPTATLPPTPAPSPAALAAGMRARVLAPTRTLWAQRASGEPLEERPSLYPGAIVDVVEVLPGAVRVRTPEGVEGWLRADAEAALALDGPPSEAEGLFAPGTRVRVVRLPAGRPLPVRLAPNSEAPETAPGLPLDAEATATELRGDWLRLRLDGGGEGWARWGYGELRYLAPAP